MSRRMRERPTAPTPEQIRALPVGVSYNKDGFYAFFISQGTDQNGKRRTRTGRGFFTAEEATAALHAARQELQHLTDHPETPLPPPPPKQWRFEEYIDRFIERRKASKTENTILGYKQARQRVCSITVAGSRLTLGQRRMDELSRDDFEAAYGYLVTEGIVVRQQTSDGLAQRCLQMRRDGHAWTTIAQKMDMSKTGVLMAARRAEHAETLDPQRRGYCGTTVKTTHQLINAMFNQAVRDKVLTENPLRGIELPKAIGLRPRRVWSPDDAASAIEFANRMAQLDTSSMPKRKPHLWILWLVALETGMRSGELCALHWTDFDFERRTVTVSRTRGETEGVVWEHQTKSGRERTLMMSHKLTEALQEWQRQCKAHAMRLGIGWDDTRHVLVDRQGKPRLPRHIDYAHKVMCKESGVPDIVVHEMRHTCATLMLKAKVSPVVIKERHGHNRVTITLDMYTHVDDDLQLQAIDAFNTLLDQEPDPVPTPSLRIVGAIG